MKRPKVFLITFLILVIAVIALVAIANYELWKMFCPPPDVLETDVVTPQLENNRDFDRIAYSTVGSIPKGARNIFACQDNHRDCSWYLAFDLEPSSARVFVERLAGVPLTEFADGITSRYYWINDEISQGLYDMSKRKRVMYPGWNLDAIKNGKSYDRESLFIAIDVDQGRVFVCRWTM
jgi:hypothetical protein